MGGEVLLKYLVEEIVMTIANIQYPYAAFNEQDPSLCYSDLDGDGYGDSEVSALKWEQIVMTIIFLSIH